ncbi:hypothetical protein Tco_0828905 [Tanacetum coccineum]
MCRRRELIRSHIKTKFITREFFVEKIKEVIQHCDKIVPELTVTTTNEMLKKEMPRLVKLAVNKDRKVSPVDISGMVSKEFATHGPKLIEELFRKHMQNTALNLYPKTKSSTATTSSGEKHGEKDILEKEESFVNGRPILSTMKRLDNCPYTSLGEQQPNNNTQDPAKVDAQGEQSYEQAPLISTSMVVNSSEEKGSEEKSIEDEPPFKKLRFLAPNPNIPSPTPLKFVMPHDIRPPVVINMSLDQFTSSIFNTTSYEFSPTPLKDDKGKGVASEEDLLKELTPHIDEGGSAPKLLNLH